MDSSCIGNGQSGERTDWQVSYTLLASGPRPAESADSTRVRRRIGSRHRRMEQRWLARWTKEWNHAGLPGTEDPGTARRRRGQAGNCTFQWLKGRDSDESQRTRFDYVVVSGFERNPAPTDDIRGSNGKLSSSW
jgi:hypothetical protein